MGVEIKGLERLRRKVSALPGVVEQAVYDATFEITEEIQGSAESRLASSIKHGSGELVGSVKNEVVQDNSRNFIGRVWTDKKTGIFRELGTGPVGQASKKDLPPGVTPVYTQTPWFFPVASVVEDLTMLYGIPKIEIQGVQFYRTSGQPARPWLYPSYREVMERAEEIYQRHVQEALKRGLK